MTFAARVAIRLGLLGLVLAGAPAVRAGSHTWDVWEIFTNADGTVQFIELREANGGNFETGLAGHNIVAVPTNRIYTIQNNVSSPTGFKSYLLATSAFAALPGAPAPDEIIPSGFITIAADTEIRYTPWDSAIWTLGALPTDGVTSLNRTGPGSTALSPGTNSPRNYAGQTGTIDASGAGTALPGVPDGTTGTPLLVGKNAADGSSLTLTWDTATCSDGNDHQILYGQKSGFPAVAGGTYTLLGGRCSIGATSPFTWTPTPAAADGSGLVWFLVVAEDDAGTEGPWGTYDGTNERNGPGTNGSSAVCSIADKELTSTCGH